MKLSKPEPFSLLLIFLSSCILLFIVAPVAGMFLSTGGTELLHGFSDKELGESIILTLLTAMGATLFFGIGAIPLAYLLARKNFPFKSWVLGIINVPVVIPHSAAGIAILGVISRNSAAGSLASALGTGLVGSPLGISIAMAFVSLPFLINAARDGFLAVPEHLEKAALNLGARPVNVFFTISLPLAWRSILSGLILMFARGMSEFGAVVIVAYHPMITPVLIYERFGSFGLKYARPAAAIFILITLVFFVLIRWLTKEKRRAERP